MIKAILFDYYGVISMVKVTGAGFVPRMAKAFSTDIDTAQKIRETYWRDLQTGELSEEKFWQSVEHDLGKQLTTKQKDIWSSDEERSPNPEILDFAKWLRERGFMTGVFSNVMPHSLRALRKESVYDGFDPVLFSCEIGMVKPEMDFYQLALDRLNLPAQEVLFIDDQERNLSPARVLHMQTVLATDPKQIIHDVKKTLSL